MGERLDYSVGERVDCLIVVEVNRQSYQCLFPGEVVYVWVDFIDVKAGGQVFRVERSSLRIGDTESDPYRFEVEEAWEFRDLEYYDPENEIDHDGEDPDEGEGAS